MALILKDPLAGRMGDCRFTDLGALGYKVIVIPIVALHAARGRVENALRDLEVRRMGSPATEVCRPVRRYDAPLLGQASADWHGFRVISPRYDPAGRREFDWHSPELGLAVRLSGQTHHEVRFEGGRSERFTVRPGQVRLLPADQRVRGHTQGIGTIREALLLLEPDWIARASGGEVNLPPLELRWSADLGNPLIREALVALVREVEQPSPLGRISGESLARVILTELVRQHAGRSGALARAAGIAPRRLRRVTDFIEAHLEAHLTGDLSLLALVTHAGVSRVHFVRQFKRLTGLAPHQYVLRRRVERAAALLQDRDACLKALALEVGFSSQSHLTAAFRRVYGCLPGPALLAGYSPPSIPSRYRMVRS